MIAKERQTCKKGKKEERRQAAPGSQLLTPLNCVLSCWDSRLQLFTNLWADGLLSGRVRKSALTCRAALRATLNAVSPCRQTKRSTGTVNNSTLCSQCKPPRGPGAHYFVTLLLQTALIHTSSTRQQHKLTLNHIKTTVNNICQATNSAHAQQMPIFHGNVFLSLKSI